MDFSHNVSSKQKSWVPFSHQALKNQSANFSLLSCSSQPGLAYHVMSNAGFLDQPNMALHFMSADNLRRLEEASNHSVSDILLDTMYFVLHTDGTGTGGVRFNHKSGPADLPGFSAEKETKVLVHGYASSAKKFGTHFVDGKRLSQALFLCNICVVFRPVLAFRNLLFIHALTNATDDHKYSPLPSTDFDSSEVLVSFSAFIFS